MSTEPDNQHAAEQPPPGRDGPAMQTQTLLACLNTFAPGLVLFCGHVYRQLRVFEDRLGALEETVQDLERTIEQQSQRDEQVMARLAACQAEAAKALNHDLEKHVLHPALEALVVLADELCRAQACVQQIHDAESSRGEVERLRREIALSCDIARQKLAHLDVQRIRPVEGDPLDPQRHAICGYAETPEEFRHGTISTLVTPGIAYQGKVLRPARVIVFRIRAQQNHSF